MTGERGRVDDATVDSVVSFVDDWRADQEIPGASVAVVDGERRRHATGLGERDRESGAPATAETLYGVGSVTKPYTAAAVLQLVDRTALALDDPVCDHVPVLESVPGEPITVGELLSHSAGLPRDFVASRDRRNADHADDVLSYVDRAAGAQRLTDRPRYMYSNAGYYVLGALVEAVDGRSYETYLEAELFDPLGMNRATLDPGALETDDDAMTGYHETDEGLVAGPFDEGAGPAGGLIAPVTELLPLLRCVDDGGLIDGERVLSRDAVTAMCRFQSPLLPAADDIRRGYGYGWELTEFLGETLVGHRGGIGVSGAYVGLMPDRGLGVALAYNRLGRLPIQTGQGVLAILAGESPREAVPLLGIAEAVEAVSGSYVAYQEAMTVTVSSGPAGTVTLDLSTPDTTVTATPEQVDDDRAVFAAQMGGGVRWLAEFTASGSEWELILSMGKWTTRLTADEA